MGDAVSPIDPAAAREAARDGAAFSNGEEWRAWSADWCAKCLRDRPFRSGLPHQSGCPLILMAMAEEVTPAQWVPNRPGSLGHQYRCTEFVAPGASGKPKRGERPMRGQLPLFPADPYRRAT